MGGQQGDGAAAGRQVAAGDGGEVEGLDQEGGEVEDGGGGWLGAAEGAAGGGIGGGGRGERGEEGGGLGDDGGEGGVQGVVEGGEGGEGLEAAG